MCPACLCTWAWGGGGGHAECLTSGVRACVASILSIWPGLSKCLLNKGLGFQKGRTTSLFSISQGHCRPWHPVGTQRGQLRVGLVSHGPSLQWGQAGSATPLGWWCSLPLGSWVCWEEAVSSGP